MWVAREEYDRMRAAQSQNITLQQRVSAQQVTNDWLMMRLTQLEHERAILIENYMGVKVPVPQIGTPAPTVDVDQVLRDPGSFFKDMGDDEAKASGVDWNDEGDVIYGVRK